MKDFTVKIAYRNKAMDSVSEWTYDFQQYAEMTKRELMRVITDVEDLVYQLQNKPKDEWDDNTMDRFQKIRHKLLDQANAIERLPQNLYYKGVNCLSMNSGEAMAKMLDSMLTK